MSSGADTKRAFRWTRWRRASQLLFVLFFLVLPLTNRAGQVEVLGTLSSLQVGAIDLVDPSAACSTMLASRQVSSVMLGGMILPLLLALTLGPVFCSWICPYGLLSEMIDKLRLRGRRRARRWRQLSKLRWATLATFMLLSLGLGLPVAATLSAPRLITVLPLELFFLGRASAGTLTLLGVLLAIELLLPRRIWCRALCPVGSTLVLFRTPWTMRVSWREPTCQPELLGANCVQVCSWNLDSRSMIAEQGCTNCGACVEGCPSDRRSLHFVPGKAVDVSDGRTIPVLNGRHEGPAQE